MSLHYVLLFIAITAGVTSIVIQLRRRRRTEQWVRCSRCGSQVPRDRRYVAVERTWFGGQRWVCSWCEHPSNRGYDPYNPWR